MTNLRQAAQQALEALERGETKLRWAAITALRAALAEPERKPLTDEELEPLLDVVPFYDIGNKDLINFARAIERAHGIGEQHE